MVTIHSTSYYASHSSATTNDHRYKHLAEIDLSKKEGARLYEIGSTALPNTFSSHGKDIRVFINGLKNRAKKCNWNRTILEVSVRGETLNILKDYGRIPMDTLKQLRQDRKDNLQPLLPKLAPLSTAP
jgi:hypothetical protein